MKRFVAGQKVEAKSGNGPTLQICEGETYLDNGNGTWVIIVGGQQWCFDESNVKYVIPCKVTDWFSPRPGTDKSESWQIHFIDEDMFSVRIARIGEAHLYTVFIEDMFKNYYLADGMEPKGCQHDWKLYKGFRFEDEYCEKCGEKRAVSF